MSLDLERFKNRGRGFVPETNDQTFAASGPCGLDLCAAIPLSVRHPVTPVLDQGATSGRLPWR